METFMIVSLLALAVIKVTDVICDYLPGRDQHAARMLLTFAAAMGAVWALDYSMFESLGVVVRDHTMGVWMTGFAVAGATVPWRAVFGFLTHDRATVDETLGDHRHRLEKVA